MAEFAHLNTWPVFEGISVNSYSRANGRRSLIFSNEPILETERELYHKTRVGYGVFDEEAVFLGMLIGKSQRGGHMGERLINYFRDTAGEVEADFGGTGIIRKPIIALSLKHAGFEPLYSSFVVEILPQPKGSNREIPQINVLENTLPSGTSTDASTVLDSKFYSVVPPEEVALKFPITTEANVVALHTAYE